MDEEKNFTKELCILLNRYSIDNKCNTPDFILADLVVDWLDSYAVVVYSTNCCTES